MGTHGAPGQRLEGWKAIARYLGKDPRTALRWVDLGLPVRRVNGRNSSVYAYAEELEAWLRRGPDERRAPAPNEGPGPPSPPARPGAVEPGGAPALDSKPTEAELLSALSAFLCWVVQAEPAAIARVQRLFLAGLAPPWAAAQATRHGTRGRAAG